MVRRFALAVVLVAVAVLSNAVLAHSRVATTYPPIQLERIARQTVIWAGTDVGNVQSVSPDGRMLAYIDRSQQPGVGIRELSTGTSRIIAPGVVAAVGGGLRPTVSESASEVVFSGDGSRVAYSWAKHRQDLFEVRITDVANAGSTRVLATMPAGVFVRLHDWSKDGKWIAIERTGGSANTAIEYVLISVADGTSRVRKTLGERGQLSRMAFSPDSRYFAYDRPASDKAAHHDAYIVSVESGAEKRAATGPADESVVGWSPDGGYLLFTSQEGSSIALRGQPVMNGSPEGPARTFHTGIDGAPAGLTASGALVMSVTADPMTVYGAEVNRETGATPSAPTPISTRRWATSWDPVYSRDGRRLAYLSQPSVAAGVPTGRPRPFLSIKSLDTGLVTVIPLRVVQILGYDWGPDARSFIAMATDLQGRYGIHLVDISTGNTTPVAIANDDTRYVAPQWAAVGRTVYYSKTPRGVLMGPQLMRNLDTNKEQVFVDWSQVRTADGSALAFVRGGAASPDDQLIAIVGGVQGGTAQIWIYSIREKSIRSVFQLPDGLFPTGGGLNWTADGRAILLNQREGTGREAKYGLWLVPTDGSKAIKLAINLPIQQLGPDVHPDGRRIAFVSGNSGNREIRLLEGFLPTSSR